MASNLKVLSAVSNFSNNISNVFSRNVENTAEKNATEGSKINDPINNTSTHDSTQPRDPASGRETIAGQDASVEPTTTATKNNPIHNEALTYPEYTLEEYKEIRSREPTIPGNTPAAKRYWSEQRRWKVIIHSLKFKTVAPQYTLNTFFLEWEIGNQHTVSVKRDHQKGSTGVLPLNFRASFEYKGSYADLLSDEIRIRLWRYKTYSINVLEGMAYRKLEDTSDGPIYNEIPFYMDVDGKSTLCRILSYNFYFQEIFDFRLEFVSWRVYGFQTSRELQYALKRMTAKTKASKEKNNHNDATSNMVYQPLEKKEKYEHPGDKMTDLAIPQEVNENVLLQCIPRIAFKLTPSSRKRSALRLISATLPSTTRPYWDAIGQLRFRGTIYELDTSILRIVVHDLQSHAFRTIAVGYVSLKGIVDQSYIETELRLPPWFLKPLGSDALATIEAYDIQPIVQGQIRLKKKPRHEQRGEMNTMNQKYINLFVHLDSVDNVITAEGTIDTNPYVDVSFEGETRSTRVLKKTKAPVFDELLIFPILLPSKNELSMRHISTKGPININVWSKGISVNEHCGSTTLTLYQIYHDEKGHIRPFSDVTVLDSETGDKFSQKTRLVELTRKLIFSFPSEQRSTVKFSCWTVPDLLKHTGHTSIKQNEICCLPPFIVASMKDYEYAFQQECLKQLNTSIIQTRYFYCYAFDQTLTVQFISTFCAKVIPPTTLDNPNIIAHYIHCINFIPDRRYLIKDPSYETSVEDSIVDKQHISRIWTPPNFTISARSGSIPDHVLLHVSYLIGISQLAFACVGTLMDGGHHMWVCTFHFHSSETNSYGYIKFWETTTNTSYKLRYRFLNRQVLKDIVLASTEQDNKDTQQYTNLITKIKRLQRLALLSNKKTTPEDAYSGVEFSLENEERDISTISAASIPKLPYRTLDMMFNHHNIWVNKQDPNPARIWFDLWNPDFWAQFFLGKYNINPCFSRRGNNSTVCEKVNIAETVETIRSQCRIAFTNHRRLRNMSTRWNDDVDLQKYIIAGLNLTFQKNTASNETKLSIQKKHNSWRKKLYSKVPVSFRLKSVILHVNTRDSKAVAAALVRRCIPFDFNAASTTFSLGVYMKQLPKFIFSVYVMLLLVYRVPSWEYKPLNKLKQKEGDIMRMMSKKGTTSKEFAHIVTKGTKSKIELSVDPVGMSDKNEKGIGNEDEDSLEKETPQKSSKSFRHMLQSKTYEEETQNIKHLTLQPAVTVESDASMAPTPPDGRAKKKLESGSFNTPWDNPSAFRSMMTRVKESLADSLCISPKKIRPYCCNYKEGIICFAIVLSSPASITKTQKVFNELKESFSEIVEKYPDLRDIIGRNASIEPSTERPRASSAAKASLKPKHRENRKAKGSGGKPTDLEDTQTERGDTSASAEKERRDQFCQQMHEANPQLYDRLRNYYKEQGYSEQDASYFAAYHAAKKLNSEG